MSAKIVVKGYQVGRQIEQTGLRTLYTARQTSTGKQVFLTVIPVRPGRSLRQLYRRAQQSKKITMPGIVGALDYGSTGDDRFFYAHEAVPSKPLADFAQHLPAHDRAFVLIRHLLSALDQLDYLHRAGTTHRDLSLGQLRVNHRGRLMMEGFVNARPRIEARNLANVVHMPYMAPEQFSGTPADPKTDLYAFGVVLYELLVGTLPYSSNYAKLEQANQGAVPTIADRISDFPEGLDLVVMRCLSPRRERYRSATSVAQDLEQVYRRRPIGIKLKDLSNSLRRLLSFSGQRTA